MTLVNAWWEVVSPQCVIASALRSVIGKMWGERVPVVVAVM